jgi:hypothetical protein
MEPPRPDNDLPDPMNIPPLFEEIADPDPMVMAPLLLEIEDPVLNIRNPLCPFIPLFAVLKSREPLLDNELYPLVIETLPPLPV